MDSLTKNINVINEITDNNRHSLKQDSSRNNSPVLIGRTDNKTSPMRYQFVLLEQYCDFHTLKLRRDNLPSPLALINCSYTLNRVAL